MIWRWYIHKVVLHLPDSWSNWNLKMLVFEERENRSTQRKTTQSKGENQQQTQPTSGFEPGPHWWEASALTSAPSLDTY